MHAPGVRGLFAAFLFLALAVGLTAAPAPVSAEEPLELAETATTVLKLAYERDVDGLNGYLTDERLGELGKVPGIARLTVENIARYIRSMTIRAADTTPVERLVKRMMGLGEAVAKANPEDPDAHRTLSSAYFIRARYKSTADLDPEVADWMKASEHALKAEKLAAASEDEDVKKEQMAHVRRAIWLVRDAATCLSQDIDSIYDRAIEICNEYSPGQKEPRIAIERAETYLNKALLTSRDKKRKKETIALVDTATKELDILAKNKKLGNRAKGLRSQAYSFLLEKKLGKPKFTMRSRKLGRGRFEVSVPEGSHWDTRGGDGHRSILSIKRETIDGNFVSIRMHAYSWASLYTTPSGEVGGDNLKGLMQSDQADDLKKMKKVLKHKKLVKGKLNRNVKKTTGYYISGIDEDNDNWYVRAYLFKMGEYQSSYSLHISIWGPNPRIDPEIEAFLKHFKPIVKK